MPNEDLDHSLDALDYFYELSQKQFRFSNFVDEKYPEIRKGVKFTPKVRTDSYSVYTIYDAIPSGNLVQVLEVIYNWCGGYYIRLNKEPELVQIDRDELLRTHRVAKR